MQFQIQWIHFQQFIVEEVQSLCNLESCIHNTKIFSRTPPYKCIFETHPFYIYMTSFYTVTQYQVKTKSNDTITISSDDQVQWILLAPIGGIFSC